MVPVLLSWPEAKYASHSCNFHIKGNLTFSISKIKISFLCQSVIKYYYSPFKNKNV